MACDLDYSRLRWDADTNHGAIWSLILPERDGLFYLDNNDNGVLDYTPGAPTPLDTNANRILDADEDYVLVPTWDPTVGKGLHHYSPQVGSSRPCLYLVWRGRLYTYCFRTEY